MTQEQLRRKRQYKVRQERRRRKQLQRLIGVAVACVAAAVVLGCICGIKICSYSHDKEVGGDVEETSANQTDTDVEETSANQTDTDEITMKTAAEIATALNDVPDVIVSVPVDYSYDEAISALSEMAESDGRYQTVLDEADAFPERLLINLANNPEMISFVAEYRKLSAEGTTVSLTDDELAVSCPLFLQWDKRWGACSYGDERNIAVSGCGPTALSMAIVALTGNAAATPDEVAEYAMNNGYYLYGTGTKWSLMTEGAASYGLESEQMNAVDEGTIKACLDAGGLVICSMREGDFTTGGHFILLYGYDEEGFSLNDPFCAYRSRQKWTYESLENQIKAAWEVYA